MIYHWQFWAILYGIGVLFTFFLCARAEGRFQAEKEEGKHRHLDTYFSVPSEWGVYDRSVVDVPAFVVIIACPISLIAFFFAGIKNAYKYLVRVSKTNANL